MILTGSIIAIMFIAIAVWMLLKKYNAYAVLLFCGLAMLFISALLNFKKPSLPSGTGSDVFDLFAYIIQVASLIF